MKRGFNDYRVEGDVAYLALTDRAGAVVAETMVDAADLPMLEAHGNRWTFRPHTCGGYVVCSAGRAKKVYLHRFLTDAPDGKVVDHLNGVGVDNRRSNLRVTTQALNAANRRPEKTRSNVGIRGIRLDRRCTFRPYRVEVGESGSLFRCQSTTLNIARITVVLARAQHYGKEAA